jgi:hypothetical protein
MMSLAAPSVAATFASARPRTARRAVAARAAGGEKQARLLCRLAGWAARGRPPLSAPRRAAAVPPRRRGRAIAGVRGAARRLLSHR